MKRIFIMIMCLITLNLSAQEVMYYIQDNDTISFEVTEDYYVSYNTSVENLIDSGLIRLVSQITDTSAIVSIQNITDSTFIQRKHIVDSMFNNVFSSIEPVLMYEDSTIQLTHNTLMIQAEHDSIVNNVLSGYSYTYDTVNVAGLMNYIITIPNISTMELFVLTTNNNDNKNLIAIEPSFIRLIESCSAVEFDDEYYPNQWALDENHYANINIQKAWEITKGENIRVAVFDTGVQKNHPDLVDNIYGGFDATGYHTGGNPYNSLDNHGTTCAGIIGAKGNNEIGIVGVAPATKIIPVKRSVSLGMISISTDCKYAFCLVYALNIGSRIFSNSWGSYGSLSKCMKYNINFCTNRPFNGKGCIFVFASGNDDENSVVSPSSMKNVLSVGAMSPCGERKSLQSCDGKNWGSNYGCNLNLVAPGVGIYTTDRTGNDGYTNSDYDTAFGGTSAACPFVAGVAALVLSVNPNLTQSEVRYIIESTCQKIQPENNPTAYTYANIPEHPNGTWNNEMGYGLVDAYKAVSLALAMACNTDNSALLNGEITSNTTISTSTIGYGEIIVKSGVTLTVSSNLKMVKASKIIVEPGAKLVVNGGEIVGSCGEYWDGIRLEGNKNLSQTETNQGVVELNNALISDAKDAISVIGENSDWDKTGGIIKATNTTFKNNRRSIEFMSYGEGSNVNNVSYFRNCTFTWDEDLIPNTSTSLAHITMYQVRGVEVSGCTFKDERTDIPSSTHGLLTLESGFNVNNYNTTDAQFNNLTFGIKTDNSGTRLCDIENAEFTNNYCGINTTTSNNLVITNNVFNIRPKTFTLGGLNGTHIDAEALGVFVESSPYPNISYNDFIGTSRPYSLVGLQVKNLGATNSVVNNNSFSSLYAGTQALGYNRGITQGFITKGLQYRCNSFSNCSKGIFVTSYGESLSNLFSGIHPNQGSSTQINNNFFALNNDNDIYNLVPYTLTYYYYRISPRNCVGITLTSTTTPGTPCGTIGITEPTDLLTNNTLGANVLSLIDEENNIDNVGNKTIFDTINEYIEDGQYNTAKTRLQNMEITSENRNEVEDYISYINKIEEYGNSYKIPNNDLIELSTHNTQVGKKASAMVYFKNINREYLPRVVREDEETSSDSSIVNKTKEQITEKGIEITEEYILTPNPANNEVEIKTANREKNTEQHITTTENTIKQVTILDLQGKELKTFDNTRTFNIAFLKNGTYIVKIKDGENKLHYQKLVKQ